MRWRGGGRAQHCHRILVDRSHLILHILVVLVIGIVNQINCQLRFRRTCFRIFLILLIVVICVRSALLVGIELLLPLSEKCGKLTNLGLRVCFEFCAMGIDP